MLSVSAATGRRLLLDAPLAAGALFLLTALVSGIASRWGPAPTEAAGPGILLASVLAVCVVQATLLTWTALRSAARGWRLAVLLFTLHFGIAAFMSQNETLYFNAALDVPASVVARYVGATFVVALLFATGMTLSLGRRQEPPLVRTGVRRDGLAWRVALLACVFYPVLYFGFGFYVLWQNDAARLLYQGSTDWVPFLDHMAATLRQDPWLYPWQCLRGLWWVGLAWLVMRDATSRWPETALLVGLLFALLMNIVHVIPNPYMPSEVRLWHFLETVPSNFLLGAGIVASLRDPARDANGAPTPPLRG